MSAGPLYVLSCILLYLDILLKTDTTAQELVFPRDLSPMPPPITRSEAYINLTGGRAGGRASDSAERAANVGQEPEARVRMAAAETFEGDTPARLRAYSHV